MILSFLSVFILFLITAGNVVYMSIYGGANAYSERFFGEEKKQINWRNIIWTQQQIP